MNNEPTIRQAHLQHKDRLGSVVQRIQPGPKLTFVDKVLALNGEGDYCWQLAAKHAPSTSLGPVEYEMAMVKAIDQHGVWIKLNH